MGVARRAPGQHEPLLTTFKGLFSYLIPKIDVQVAGTFSSRPGVSLLANQVYTSAQVANPALSTLGRPLAQVATVTVNLIEPNTLFEDRVTQVDIRFAKTLPIGRVRLRGTLDIYNVFNVSASLVQSAGYAPDNRWLRPTSTLGARLFKLGGELTF